MCKFIVSWILARLMYYIGDFVSKFGYVHSWGWCSNIEYKLYNKCMFISVVLDDWGNTNLWEHVSPDKYEDNKKVDISTND